MAERRASRRTGAAAQGARRGDRRDPFRAIVIAGLILVALPVGAARAQSPQPASPPATSPKSPASPVAPSLSPSLPGPHVPSAVALHAPDPANPPPALALPIACEPGVSCVVQNYVDIGTRDASRDWSCGTRSYHEHNGVDFRLPSMVEQRRGVDVLAAAAGTVRGARDGEPDISVKTRGAAAVAGRECGNGVVIDHGRGWTTQYCHMARGSLRVKPGDRVAAGTPLGQVGLSGVTEYPHLHFTLRAGNTVVEPFAVDLVPGTCGLRHKAAWLPEVAAKLPYVERSVLNIGFAPGGVSPEAVEEGTAGSPASDAASPGLVLFVRSIGLKRGDVQRLEVTGPDGKPWFRVESPPLDRDKAQVLQFGGRRRPEGGFAPGLYRARFEVLQEGKVVLSHDLAYEVKPGKP